MKAFGFPYSFIIMGKVLLKKGPTHIILALLKSILVRVLRLLNIIPLRKIF